jgi:hypothetical protein
MVSDGLLNGAPVLHNLHPARENDKQREFGIANSPERFTIRERVALTVLSKQGNLSLRQNRKSQRVSRFHH